MDSETIDHARTEQITTDRTTRAVLLAASCFRVPFAPEALSAVFGNEGRGDRVGLLFTRLLDYGLLGVHPDHRVECPGWLATALRARLDPETLALLPQFHYNAGMYWLTRAVDIARHDPYPIRGNDTDIHNFLEADEHFLNAGRIEYAVAATIMAAQAMRRQGSWADRKRIIDDHLTLPELDGRSRGYLLYELSSLASDLGDYNGAMAALREAAVLLGDNSIEPTQRISYTLQASVGMILDLLGRRTEAEAIYRETLERARAAGDREAKTAILTQLAMLTEMRGDLDRAEPLYLEALHLEHELGNHAAAAIAIHQLGMIAQFRHDYASARAYYEAAARVREQVGDVKESAMSTAQLGVLAMLEGSWEGARRLTTQALEVFDSVGYLPGTATCFEKLGVIAHARREFEVADGHLRRSLEINRTLGMRDAIRSAVQCLAKLAVTRGDYHTAIVWYEQLAASEPEVAPAENSWAVPALIELQRLAAASADYSGLVRRAKQLGAILAAGHDGPFYQIDLPHLVALTGDVDRADELLREIADNVYRPALAKTGSGIEPLAAARRYQDVIDHCRRDLVEARREYLTDQELICRTDAEKAGENRQFDEAGRLRRLATSFTEQIAALQPSDHDLTLDVANSYDDLGDLALTVGRLTEAEDWYGRSMQIRESMLSNAPGHQRTLRSIAVLHERRTMIAEMFERHTDAVEYFAKAESIRAELAREHPDNLGLAEEYAANLTLLAQLESNRLGEAQRRILALLEPFERLGNLTNKAAALLLWARSGRPTT